MMERVLLYMFEIQHSTYDTAVFLNYSEIGRAEPI